MSNSGGRPHTRSQAAFIPVEFIVSTLGSLGESSSDLRQEMIEMRGMLIGLMRVVDTLATNQRRQGQGSQEAGGSGCQCTTVVTVIS